MKWPDAILVTALPLVGAIIGSTFGPTLDYALRSRQMDIKMVGHAVDILKSDRKTGSGIVPARQWAVQVIDKFAFIHFSEQAKAALLHNSIAPGAFSTKDFSSGFDIARNPCK